MVDSSGVVVLMMLVIVVMSFCSIAVKIGWLVVVGPVVMEVVSIVKRMMLLIGVVVMLGVVGYNWIIVRICCRKIGESVEIGMCCG